MYLFTKRKFRHVVIGLLLSHVSLVSHASDSNIIENLPQEQFRKMGKFSKLLQKDLGFKEKHFEACNNFLNITFKDSGHQFIWRLKAICENANILFHKEMSDENRIEMLKTAFKLQTEEINSRTNSFKTHENDFSNFLPKGMKLDDSDVFKRNLFTNYSAHETNTLMEILNKYRMTLYQPCFMEDRISILNIAVNFGLDNLKFRFEKIQSDCNDFLYESKGPIKTHSELIIYLMKLENKSFTDKMETLSQFKKSFDTCIKEKEEFNKSLYFTLYNIDTEETQKRLEASKYIFNILFKVKDISFNTPIDKIASFFYKNEASKILSLKDMDDETKVKTITSYDTDKLPSDFKNMEIKHQLQLIEIFSCSYQTPEKLLKKAIEQREILFPNKTFGSDKNEILPLLLFHDDRANKIQKNSLYLASEIVEVRRDNSIYYQFYWKANKFMEGEERYKMVISLLRKSDSSFDKELDFPNNAIKIIRSSNGASYFYK